MTPDERTAKWIADLYEVDRMTQEEAKKELTRQTKSPGMAGIIAAIALATAPRS